MNINELLINSPSSDITASVLKEINTKLAVLTAEKRISWILENMPQNFMLSSSFGIQSAVSLHLITCQYPQIPIVLIDTGYLFPETYRFIDELTDKMKLNLMVFHATISPAWQEARYGKLWEQGIQGIEKYNKINKIEPMNHAVKKLSIKTWFSGLRRVQAKTRANLPILLLQKNIFKVLPIVDWDNRKIFQYMKKFNLQYHPLYQEGYISVGDTHTTEKWVEGVLEEKTRFFGLKRECGLHEN